MNEKVDLAKLRKDVGKAPSTRSPDIRPASRIALANRSADLVVPHMIQGRTVNAPQMANFVPFKRLKNKTRGNAMSNASFDYIAWPKMPSQVPNCPHKAGITVIAAKETLRANPNPLYFQLFYDSRPQLPELRSRRARPGYSEPIMKPAFPIFLGLKKGWGCTLFPPMY